jgi:Ca2+-binding EF-hand superfamily protein
MKAAFLFPSLLAATQFLVSATAAEPDATAARDAAIIKRYDTNKDGKLDEAEVAAVKEMMLMESQENKEARRERLQDRKKTWLDEFDTDKDGKLDDAEKAAMETVMRARAEKRPQLLKRLDTDGDGKLSDAEWIAGREKILARIEEAKGKDKK